MEDQAYKADYYDKVLSSTDLITVTQIAKDYGMSAKGFNALLHEMLIQYKQGEVWHLYQKYAGKGYTRTKTNLYAGTETDHSKLHTYWTQKGRLFLYELLKAKGILPIAEREFME